jgi:hypothetical protein
MNIDILSNHLFLYSSIVPPLRPEVVRDVVREIHNNKSS